MIKNNKITDPGVVSYFECQFSKVIDSQDRLCAIVHDEIHLKQGVNAHAGELFGHAHDKPDKLAKTCLLIYIMGVNGGLNSLRA